MNKKRNTDRLLFVAYCVVAAVLLAVMLGVAGCRKAAFERVLGKPISWWDYIVLTSR